LGSIKKEVGTSVYKGGHNDLRKTSYDVKIKDGKFQLDTHKTVLTENGKLSRIINSNINEGITLSREEKKDIETTLKTIKKTQINVQKTWLRSQIRKI
jgi:hypothetical protein